MARTLLITGATGNVGTEIIAELRRRGRAHDVVAAVTNSDNARAQLGNDIGYVRFDFADPSTFGAAFAGVEKLFLMRPPQITDIPRYITPALRAAKEAGVRQVVFLSLSGVESIRVVPHAKVEAALRDIDIPWTMLRPSFFMQNLSTTHRDEIRDDDEIFVPAGNGRTSFIDVRDIGAVGGAALDEDWHTYQAYELTGSEALTYGEVAGILSDVLNRRITYRKPSLMAFFTRWKARGVPTQFILVMSGIYTVARLGFAGRLSDDLPRLLGRNPITMRQYIEDYKTAWERP